MRFLVDANLPRQTASVVQDLGFEAMDVRDVGLGAASDEAIAEYAKKAEMALISRDYDFADTRNYPPSDYFGIVVLSFPKDVVAGVVIRKVSEFLGQADLLAKLSGRPAIVEMSRVRFKPA